jgi:hypothetical protein
MSMPVPDDLLDFFARAQKGKCTVTYTKQEVRVATPDGNRVMSIARPCTMPELEALAASMRK